MIIDFPSAVSPMHFPPRKLMFTDTTATATATAANSDSCLLDCDSVFNPDGNCHAPCFSVCPSTCKFLFVDDDDNFYPLFPQPPPPSPTNFPLVPSLVPAGSHFNRKNLLLTSMTVAGSAIGFALLIGIFCILLQIWRSRRRRGNLSFSRRLRDPSAIFATQDDFIAEDHGPVIDHPIWYIHTVGLEQSIIESIAVFRYRKEEKFIDGTDCSVCLSEFEEDESLRLLPKCSHAFHIPCIDTWLRSHKNCPLCRAPVISAAPNSVVDAAPAAVGSSGNLNSGEDSAVENSEPATPTITTDENEEEREEDGEVRIGRGNSSSRNGVELSDHSKRLMALLRRSHSRVQSNVSEGGEREGAGDLQGVRRSVSLDSSSAMVIYRAVGDIEVGEGEGEGKNLEARELKRSCSKPRNGGKRGASLSFRKFMKSGSIIGLQKAPVSMKRSNSSSKASTSRHGGRSHDSILPF